MTLQIAALSSSNGTNVAAILAAASSGRLDARVRLVLSNNPSAPVLDKARAAGVPVWVTNHRDFADRESFDLAMIQAIEQAGADTVVLAGYMRMLSPAFVRRYAGRILNIHPAILPSFPGTRAGADALDYGVRLSGVTVHFVDEEMDHGPVIIQAAIPVTGSDTVESLLPRLHALEHRLYPQALQWLSRGRLRVEGRKVILLPAKRSRPNVESVGQGTYGPWLISPPIEDF